MQPEFPQDDESPPLSARTLPIGPDARAKTSQDRVDSFLQAVESAMDAGRQKFLTAWTATWCDIPGVDFASVYWCDRQSGDQMVGSARQGASLPPSLEQAAWWNAVRSECQSGDAIVLHPDVEHPLSLEAADDRLRLIRPLVVAGRVRAITVVGLDVANPVDDLQGLWDSSIAILDEYSRRVVTEETSDDVQRLLRLETILKRVYTCEGTAEIAQYAVNGCSQWLDCERLMVAYRRGGRWQVLAVTGVQRVDKRGDLYTATCKLANAVAKYGEVVSRDDEELPPQIDGPLEAWIDASHLQQVVVVPCSLPENQLATDQVIDTIDAPTIDGKNQREAFHTVLIAGNFAPVADSARSGAADAAIAGTIDAARVVQLADHVGAAMASARRFESQPFAKTARFVQRLLERSKRRRSLLRVAIAVGVLLACAAILSMPVPFTVQVTGHIQPEIRQIVFAPADGVISDVHIEHGEAVEEDGELLKIQRNALRFDVARLEGERNGLLTQLDNLAKSSLRSASGDDAAHRAQRNAAEQRRLQDELNGVERQIEIAKDETDDMVLRAPFAGIVLSRSPNMQFDSRPVTVGDELLVVADFSGAWQLQLQCAEQDIRHVRNNVKDCRILFATASQPSATWNAELAAIEQVTQLNEQGRAFVTLRAIVQNPERSQAGGDDLGSDNADARQWTPGMSVSARLYLGKQPLGYILTRRLVESIRYQFFF
jgi:hypothetical protein